MIIIETHYLIDYENVSSSGLTGCDKLNQTDHIVIFFTRNAKKIDMSEIADHGNAELEMVEIPVGKQSVDIHISSYLGYLAGKYEGRDLSVVIISKDTDFDNVAKFWKAKMGIHVSRAQQIRNPAPNPAVPKQPQAPKKVIAKVSGARKTKLNQEAMQAIRKAGYPASVANTVAQIAAGHYAKEHMLIEVHNALRDRYSDYLDLYHAVKPVLSKYADDVQSEDRMETVAAKDRTAVNTQVMRLLSKAGYPNGIIADAASTAVKNLGVKNGKQQTYRTMISKYGQSKGQAIYNQIKKHIF